MNKYIKYSLCCILGAGMLTACDVMNTSPTESFDEDLVWSSKATIDGFIYSAYAEILKKDHIGFAGWEARTPNGIKNDFSSIDDWATETGIDANTDGGFNRFELLRRCNLIIERVVTTGISDTEKKELVAEGHFLRGLIFFAQARAIGRFVPVTKVLTQEDTEAFKMGMTKDVAESYTYVINDFQKAATDMSEVKISGRANRFVALGYLSRAALQAYAYTKDVKYLNISKNAALEVIEKSGYTLSTDYEKMFLEAGAKDNEIMFARYYLEQNSKCSDFPEVINCVPNINPSQDLTWSGGSPALSAPSKFESWATFFPTQNLVDQYLMIDAQDGKAKLWYETTQYKNAVDEGDPSSLGVGSFYSQEDIKKLGVNGWVVPDEEDMGSNAKGPIINRYGVVKSGSPMKINELMYSNRDKRFYGTIVYDSCQWLGENVTTCIRGNIYTGTRQYGKTSQYTTSTNYYWKKGVYDAKPRVYHSSKTNYHYVLCRLGEMYMNLAEVYLLEKNVAEAVKMLNMTRVQHGQIPASAAATEEEAWKDYIRERRVEMAQENDIYWSYLRWGQYGGYANEGAAPGAVIKDLDRPVHKIMITKDRKRFFTAQVVYSQSWNRNFTTKRYLLPIPKSELDKRAASGINDNYAPVW